MPRRPTTSRAFARKATSPPSRRLAVASVLFVAACSTASNAVEGTARTAAAGVEAVVDAGANVTAAILPIAGPTGVDRQRAQMEQIAGPAHYRNDDLKAGKEAMIAHHATFESFRSQFVSPQFQEARAQLRSGTTRPSRGPVLGAAAAALNDPDLARAVIVAAAASQVPVVPVQPVLAQLLPAFGN